MSIRIIAICAIFCAAFNSILLSEVRIILTAAISEKHYELRKLQYIESFQCLKNYGYHNVYVVEALQEQGPTYLDDYTPNVFYSQKNDPDIYPGFNENRTLLDALYHFNFDPDDMIIKITGRDYLTSNEFIEHVKQHPKYNAVFKSRDRSWLRTELFAMRCKHLITMCEWVDKYIITSKLRARDINPTIEIHYSQYLRPRKKHSHRKTPFQINYVKKLGIRRQLLGSTSNRFLYQEANPDEYEYY